MSWLAVGGRAPLIIWCLAVVIACSPFTALAQSPVPPRRVNAPYFASEVRFAETAVFWFGHVDSASNYADVRVGYNDEYLSVRITAFDRFLWYDTTPTLLELEHWDSATLYLDVNHDGGGTPRVDDHRFVGQLVWWESRESYQTAYVGDGSAWILAGTPFTTTSEWRGEPQPNDNQDDRGWFLEMKLPFESFGLSGPPSGGTVWGMAVVLHDRDDAAGTPIADKVWPEAMQPDRPDSWAALSFGLPSYSPPAAIGGDVITIRQGAEGVLVPDAAVGGTIDNLCRGNPDFIWNQWGEANFAGAPTFNLQNQRDVADWPCFAKYFVTFPLDTLPMGKVIISATLTMHTWGGSDPELAQPSLVQVLTVADEWDEATLTWNNAPLAQENVSSAWVGVRPYPPFGGWPGVPCTWDVGASVAEAYASEDPLRLSIYEADEAQHSGKYFSSSDAEDWNVEARPTLRVRWGDPVGTVAKRVFPTTALPGNVLTYTLAITGDGQALTLSDQLPSGVSAPIAHSSGLSYTPHRLGWAGSPDLGQSIALTYAVTITTLLRGPLWNQAVLTSTSGLTLAAAALVMVDPVRLYLPLTIRNRT